MDKCKECHHYRDWHDEFDGCTYELWDDGQWFLEGCDCKEFV